MNIAQEIEIAFKLSNKSRVSDSFIESNADLMWLSGEINLCVYVPSYMIWCLTHKEENGNLVCDYTINALAEYGRAKSSGNEHLNFKNLCNFEQIQVVQKFLLWCGENLELCNKEQIQRTLKHWR